MGDAQGSWTDTLLTECAPLAPLMTSLCLCLLPAPTLPPTLSLETLQQPVAPVLLNVPVCDAVKQPLPILPLIWASSTSSRI